MATYTPNLNLGKPEATDAFSGFRQLFNDNMDILDNGGGGGSGGHTIVDENGSDMPAEGKLQFTGNVQVTDDNGNGKTVVDIIGGGGDTVLGAFIDINNVITSGTYSSEYTYTATQDCAFRFVVGGTSESAGKVYLDGVIVQSSYSPNNNDFQDVIFLKKGQTVKIVAPQSGTWNYTVYGIQHGTHAIGLGECYSTTEKEVGCWTDGKPLYQRTWEFPSSVLVSYSSWTNTAIDSSDIENIITVKAKHADGTCFEGIMANPTVSGHTLVGLQTTRNGAEANVKTLTLQYTKISDTAGSGTWTPEGSYAVHYSTSEQVIGTWIDGKPLYAKTINFGSIPSNTTKEVDHNISALKMTVGFEGTMMSGSVCETLPSGENSNFRIQTTSSKLKVITGASWSGWDTSYITIKYTKTTD